MKYEHSPQVCVPLKNQPVLWRQVVNLARRKRLKLAELGRVALEEYVTTHGAAVACMQGKRRKK